MKRFCAFLLAVFALVGCNSKPKVSPGADYMICGDVVYGGKFQQSHTLENPEKIELDIIGGLDFIIRDSLLIFSTSDGSGYWSFFYLPSYNYLGKYLRQGRGPNEFAASALFCDAQLYNSNGRLLANTYDFGGGKYYEIDITKTLADSILTAREIENSTTTQLYNSVVIDDNTILYRNLQDDGSLNRYLLKNGVKDSTEVLDKLNMARVKSNSYSNLLYAPVAYLRNSGRIVEVPVMLNYFNIYALDGSFAKTICTDGELLNISEMEKVSIESMPNTYICTREYGNMFAVLREFDRGERFAIQFFDIDGKPLVEFLTNHPCRSFDVDFSHNHLYLYSYKTEEFVRYDVAGMLDLLKK